MTQNDYNTFLESKRINTISTGFDINVDNVNPLMFDFQKDITKWSIKKGKSAVFAGTGLGKCMGFNTPILMYDGTTKPIQEILPNDLLMGPNSKPRTVLSTTSGYGDLYKVTPIKGDSFVCNDVHVLSLKCTSNHANKYKKDVITNIPINEYIEQNPKFKHMMKLWRTPIDFKWDYLDIDPYFIGAWLGDGNYQAPCIHKTDKDYELCDYFVEFAKMYNTGLTITPIEEHNTIKWYFSKGLNGGNETWILKKIRECQINGEKRIPKKYLINSISNRLLILAGLLDTDGHLIDKVYEITTKYKGLSEDILFLARSLGLAAYCSKEIKQIKSIGFKGCYYRIYISGNTHEIPVKLARKKAKERRQKKDVLKTGFGVEHIDKGDYYGFELDGDGLYVLGDFTVTHNTVIQLEWAKHIHEHENKPILILAPLAVSNQTVQEGKKFNIDVNLCRTQSDVINGINITNYEMLHHFDISNFIGIVLDESSILKSFTGKVRTEIIEQFQYTQYKLACTATPSPNDYMELGNHAEFLNVMSRTEMLSTFFVHDGGNTSKWRLKKHAVKEFWMWVSSWAVMLRNPIDLGYMDADFNLPELRIHEIIVDKTGYRIKEAQTLNERRNARRNSINDRVSCAAEIANLNDDCCLVWCDLNTESEMLTKSINDAVEIKGAHTSEYKSQTMINFSNGDVKCLVTKGKIAGFGMNWQHCNKMVFVGLSDSFELYYQCVRRCWRFGQKHPVDVYIITSEKEGAVVKNIKRKEKDFEEMLKGMIATTQELTTENIKQTCTVTDEYLTSEVSTDKWKLIMSDNIESIKQCDDDSIHFICYSPPFSSLYTYSNSPRDMGNCRNDDEFFNHFKYLSSELYRVLMPGRLMSCHCMNIPSLKSKDGFIGIKDFRGDLIKLFQDIGFIYHSEVVIWKDPVVAMQRTKALGLLHKQIKKDSAMCRQGIPDYLVTFRKPGDNSERVTHTNESFPVGVWQNYASPVWMDINPSDTLQKTSAREFEDERHIAPLQLQVIERAIDLWTNPNDLILDPFSGIGSTGYVAVKKDRRYLGFELKKSYFDQSVKNLKTAEYEAQKPKQIGMECFGEKK